MKGTDGDQQFSPGRAAAPQWRATIKMRESGGDGIDEQPERVSPVGGRERVHRLPNVRWRGTAKTAKSPSGYDRRRESLPAKGAMLLQQLGLQPRLGGLLRPDQHFGDDLAHEPGLPRRWKWKHLSRGARSAGPPRERPIPLGTAGGAKTQDFEDVTRRRRAAWRRASLAFFGAGPGPLACARSDSR
jgi:hypothetical protein